jgi:multidrug efflux system outer membrane protein
VNLIRALGGGWGAAPAAAAVGDATTGKAEVAAR